MVQTSVLTHCFDTKFHVEELLCVVDMIGDETELDDGRLNGTAHVYDTVPNDRLKKVLWKNIEDILLRFKLANNISPPGSYQFGRRRCSPFNLRLTAVIRSKLINVKGLWYAIAGGSINKIGLISLARYIVFEPQATFGTAASGVSPLN